MRHPEVKVVEEYLRSLRLGRPQVMANFVLFPLRSWSAGSVPYLSLAEAVAAGLLHTAEVDSGSGPPDLEIRNTAERPVLMLRGEVLPVAGPKRVLTTTVLLEKNGENMIPASCFERDRPILEPAPLQEIRERECLPPSRSRFMKFRPDHSTIFSKVDALRDAAVPRQSSKEIADPAEARRQALRRAGEVFRRVSGQKGMLFLANNEPIGFDIVSEESCFARQHDVLVKDYIAEGMSKECEGPADAGKAGESAKGFLDEAIGCRGEAGKAIACGNNYIYHRPSMTGSALVHQDRVVHVAFHRLDADPAARRPAAPDTGRQRSRGGPIGIVEPAGPIDRRSFLARTEQDG